MLRFLKTMVEAVKDVTITEEVVAVNAEAQADLEEEVLVVAEASGQEKKADSEATEMMLQEPNVLTDQEETVSIATAPLQKENQVLFKEKAAHRDVLKVQVTSRQVAHLKLQKAEDQERANPLRGNCEL